MSSIRTDDALTTQTSTKATTRAKSRPPLTSLGTDALATQTSAKATTPAKSIPRRRPLDLIPDENNPHCWAVPDPSVQHVYE